MKSDRLKNIKFLQNCNLFNDFFYSETFFKSKLHCLLNHKLKIVIANSSDIKYCYNIDYHFITYKNLQQFDNFNFLDEINKTIQRNKWILNKAKQLNDNLPASEKWFHEKFRNTEQNKIMNFKSNQIFRSLYICDLISIKYKTIIEIDGSFHELPQQKLKDEIKDRKYLEAKFNIIRVKYEDEFSFDACLKKLTKIINEFTPYDHTKKLKSYRTEEKVYVRKKIKVDQDDFKSRINTIDLSKKLPF